MMKRTVSEMFLGPTRMHRPHQAQEGIFVRRSGHMSHICSQEMSVVGRSLDSTIIKSAPNSNMEAPIDDALNRVKSSQVIMK